MLLVGLPAAASAAPDPLAGYENQQLTWAACPFSAGAAKPAQCALVTVPRDWAAPASGVDMKVQISRVAATGASLGAILVNPGGPGGQGSSLAGALASLEPSVSARYDFIGMDPRGTGHEGGTKPEDQGVLCNVPTGRLPVGVMDAGDRSAASIAAHQQVPRAIAEACQSLAESPFLTTWQTAHDMDLIRQLLGQAKLNYLGYSYGTWLGAKYASLFPASAGKIVLDSSVNWQGRLLADFEDFPVIDQRQFDDVYVPWLTRNAPDVFGSTTDVVHQKWQQVRDYYKAHGVSPDNFNGAFVGMGSKLAWLLATAVFENGVKALGGAATAPAALQSQLDTAFGKPMAAVTTADVGAALQPDYTQISDVRIGVACGDQPTRSAAWYKALSDRQGPKYPLFGWAYGISESCGFWSDAPRQTLPTLPPSVAKSVLVVQGEFDPQTGYDQAHAAVAAAPGVSLISVDDSPYHGQYALTANPCVDGMVNVFLLDNSRPGSAVCPGVPLIGEDQVFPVPGPVKTPKAAARSFAPAVAPSALRDQTQDFISKTNSLR
ncbi:alpha/beta fold hydrolase [Kutzneria sp. NPDC051319]|uniref:alpha/beta fold hydrolase n=1 Tax=Kutzneria sp. NPDC051319 TaxID=3155047 RepID=UPI00342B58CA